MSGLLLERSLIGMAWCPFCRADVVLGDCEPHEVVDTGVLLYPEPDRPPTLTRWWVCWHGPLADRHRWDTAGPIEIRPVWSVHVEVLDPDRPLRVPAPPDRTTSSAAHTGAAATTTAATTPRTADAAAATNTRRAAAGPPHRRR